MQKKQNQKKILKNFIFFDWNIDFCLLHLPKNHILNQ